jgi:hypothetical protein
MSGDDQAFAQSSPQDTQGTKRALLIGINKYKSLPRLQGSLNDIETMRQILLTRWGFSEANIMTVIDEAATRVGMLAALEQLVKESKPNDTVYVHYSGHGSQVEDLNGDEPEDHLDETLVPQDGRTGAVRDITDDELDAIFARMRAKTAFIVLDSCHSGTATRSVNIRTRSVPPDTRVEIYRAAESALPKSRAVVPVVTSRYVVMTGAASHQEALDGPVDGRYHGFFTYALSKSLGSASPTASPREVFAGVEQELRRIQTHFGRSSMPEPQLEAPPELIDNTLLGTARTSPGGSNARLPWAKVQSGDEGQILLINGLLIGAVPGSMWSLYPPDETKFPPGRAMAVATVTQTIGKDARAKLHFTTAKLTPGCRAVLLLPAPTGDRIPIRILDVPIEQRKAIEDTIKSNLKGADIVDENKPTRFLIDVRGKTLRLLTADGLQVVATFGVDESWGSGLATIVSRSANASELLSLDNPSSQLKIEVRVANAAKRHPSLGTRGVTLVAADTRPAQYRIRRPDDPRTEHNSLQLEVRVNANAYLTIVDVDSEGGVNLLFPNAYQSADFWPKGFIRANETVWIPDSIQTGSRAGFYWDYSPPKGTDTIRVFTSTDYQTAQMIQERIQGLQKAQGRGGVGTRAVSSAVRTLRETLSTRGILMVQDATPHVPGPVSTPNGQGNVQEAPGVSQETASGPPPPSDVSSPPALDPSTSSNQVPGPSATAADWAATSLTISVQE